MNTWELGEKAAQLLAAWESVWSASRRPPWVLYENGPSPSYRFGDKMHMVFPP
jgi:hypothetical protein